MSVSVITPTGGRPEALALLARMMARQTYRGALQWIVVDDVNPASPVPPGAEVIRPEPRWQTGQNTQARNLLAGLEAAKGEYLFIMEDDDWYAPDYIRVMILNLEHAGMVGEGRARYYHVGRRLWRRNINTQHASLCQTALRRELVERLAGLCRQPRPFIDIDLWKQGDGVITRSDFVVGIKGLPGRPGIGEGHRAAAGRSYNADPKLSTLRAWIGADADWYAGFGEAQ